MDEILQIKTSHYIIGAVALVVALSWNSSIKAAINKYFPVPDDELMANFVYAFLITCFLVLLIIWLPNTTSELPAGYTRKDYRYSKKRANECTYSAIRVSTNKSLYYQIIYLDNL